METIEIEGFIKDYYKQIYVNKMDKLEEMGKSLERFNIPGITNEEIDNMNIPNPSTEIESIIKKLSTKKSPGPEDFTGKFYQPSREEFAPNLLKLFQKIAEEGTLPNPLHTATIILIPKPDQDIPKKKNYLSISLINIDAKILNKILANQIKQHNNTLKESHDQVAFIPEIQVFNIRKSVT